MKLRYYLFPKFSLKGCFLFGLCWIFSNSLLQGQSSVNDSIKKERIKKGINVGALPAIAFDSDLGFRYGALANIYHYGDGSVYPRYKHSLYLEWSRTTKGSGLNQIIYDTEYLIPNIRLTVLYEYLTEKAMDFYGFNGYEAFYNPAFEDDKSSSYISRMYYRHERTLNHLKIDFQGNIIGRKLRWNGGIEFMGNSIATVNIQKLNKGKSKEDMLPDTALLYDKMVDWGVIPSDQKNGGNNTFLKLGLVYDTRDNEPNPMRGMWTEAIYVGGLPFLGDRKYSFSKIAITHRQYFTLRRDILNFAYRLSYQPKISGTMPFYALPFIFNTMITRDGLGGAKTLRGILRNRVVGEDYLYGNFELRWKVLRTIAFNQNIYIALAGFFDSGKVTTPFQVSSSSPDANTYLASGSVEKWHNSIGGGFYIAMNQNFVVNISFGHALDKQDGTNGLYIGLNFLY